MAGLTRPEDFDVWKLAWELERSVFAFTAASPASGDRRYCDDIRRAARSGPDLVAEGYYRFNPREFHRFLNDAKASLGEVRNQLLHAKDERLLSDSDFLEMLSLADRAMGAANALQAYLRSCPSKFAHRPPRQTYERRIRNPEPAPRTATPRTENRPIDASPFLTHIRIRSEGAPVLGSECWVLGSGFRFYGAGFGVAGGGNAVCTAASMARIRRPEDFDAWEIWCELKRRVIAYTATLPASRGRRSCRFWAATPSAMNQEPAPRTPAPGTENR